MKREPQTDDLSIVKPLKPVEAEPDHKPKPEKDGLAYPDVERDKDGWIVPPTRNDRPPLWRK